MKIDSRITHQYIKDLFDLEAAAFLRKLNLYDEYFEKYRDSYFEHVKEGSEYWELNDKGKEILTTRLGVEK